MQDCPTGGESEGTVLIIDCVEFHSARRKRKGPGGLAAGLTCKKEKEGDEERVGLIKKGGGLSRILSTNLRGQSRTGKRVYGLNAGEGNTMLAI